VNQLVRLILFCPAAGSENQHEQTDDNQQAYEKNDTDGTGKKLKHALLPKKGVRSL